MEPSEAEVCKISEIALQDIYGLLADWDEDSNGQALSREFTLRWLYALLCLTEKPLLADQAADMNSLLGRLRMQQASAEVVRVGTSATAATSLEDVEKLAVMQSLSIALITEHFDQRFR